METLQPSDFPPRSSRRTGRGGKTFPFCFLFSFNFFLRCCLFSSLQVARCFCFFVGGSFSETINTARIFTSSWKSHRNRFGNSPSALFRTTAARICASRFWENATVTMPPPLVGRVRYGDRSRRSAVPGLQPPRRRPPTRRLAAVRPLRRGSGGRVVRTLPL